MQNRTTKSLIVKTAEELILSYGYQGFSYNDIASAINIRKASIHYHFPKKEDLGIAFIRKYSRLFSLWGKRLGSISNKEKLIAFCRMYGSLSNGCTRICPIGMVAADYHSMPEGIREHSQRLIAQVEEWLTDLVEKGKEAGEFRQYLSSSDTARHMIYVMSGSLKMARIFKEPGRIKRAEKDLVFHICNE
ncbi:TetR/AcrR family transcriptional regulator [Spirochaeta isovalerica]|uniref:AcrR family transcriptional regulator n=1 Tax=Spirochaeta isovalerica TaxID=150 RepID=A0A841R7B0_9SPIO|nr:TetR/AcrR family transcriptional regulator [Spirochaeta isovalerica]MBB6479716.1 AcrR family transcriptional regulator [Spirochaeta isovalerica]